jgi:toxin-antitoxin system PIN domain toxin
LIALDTQILVYAHRSSSSFHLEASRIVEQLVQGGISWALPWPVAHEFLGVVTHPRLFKPPSTLEEAFGFLDSLLNAPGCRPISEGPAHLESLKEIAYAGKIAGPAIHDARIAALCLAHGVKELWSADRDFSRMKGLKVRNPLTA